MILLQQNGVAENGQQLPSDRHDPCNQHQDPGHSHGDEECTEQQQDTQADNDKVDNHCNHREILTIVCHLRPRCEGVLDSSDSAEDAIDQREDEQRPHRPWPTIRLHLATNRSHRVRHWYLHIHATLTFILSHRPASLDKQTREAGCLAIHYRTDVRRSA